MLVPVAVVLAIVGDRRDLEAIPGYESRLLLVGLGGAVALSFAAVGLLISRVEPRNSIGWIFLSAAALLATSITTYAYDDLVVYGGEPWPAAPWVAWLGSWSFIPAAYAAAALVAQVFPDGRSLPGVWRWVLASTIAIAAFATLTGALTPGATDSYKELENPLGMPGPLGGVLGVVNDGGVVMAPPVFAAALAALVARFRRSRGIEREQIKWLAFGGAVPVIGFALSFIWGSAVGDDVELTAIFATAFAGLLLIPAAVAIAILRYRLYEIDRVISKTLVYGSLTVVLGAAYAALVLAGQALFSSMAGGSNLAIAVSTLVVAALFLPVRARLQRVVDRRFYRRRYDAEHTLAAFGTRLRDQVELDGLCADLERVVADTMQPAHVSLWLREARP